MKYVAMAQMEMGTPITSAWSLVCTAAQSYCPPTSQPATWPTV